MTEDNADKMARMEETLKQLQAKFTEQNKELTQLRRGEKVEIVSAGARLPCPKLVEQMSFDEYKSAIEIWRESTDLRDEDQGPVMLQGLPLKGDSMGGMQRAVYNIVKDKLKTKDGPTEILQALKSFMLKPDYNRLLDWLDIAYTTKQKAGWSMERWIQESARHMKKAKDDFDMEIPDMMKAGLLVRGVTQVDRNFLTAMLKDVDFSSKSAEANLVRDTENALRKVVIPGGGSAAGSTHNIRYTDGESDAFGNTLKRRHSVVGQDFDEYEDSGVYYAHGKGRGGRGGGRGRGSKSARGGRGRNSGNQEAFDKEKEKCRAEGLCFKCKSKDHRLENCPEKFAETL